MVSKALSERQLNYKLFSAYIKVLSVALWGLWPCCEHTRTLSPGHSDTQQSVFQLSQVLGNLSPPLDPSQYPGQSFIVHRGTQGA